MVKQSERDVQKWHERVARERTNLSASVEETLADGSLEEEDEEWLDELDERASSSVEAPEQPVIPPRLSLQSKVMVAAQPNANGQSPSSPAAGEAGTPTPKQSANILSHFARRLTSSLAAFGGSWQPAGDIVSPDPPSAPPRDRQPSQHVEGTAIATDAVPAVHPKEPSRPAHEKKRLAGRATRVHLEAAPKPKSVPTSETEEHARLHASTIHAAPPASYESRALHKLATNPNLPAVSGDEKERDAATNPRLPALKAVEEQRETVTNASLPAVSESAAQQPVYSPLLTGSGVFERGQSEAAVASVHISQSSVVVVMLAADPGPVVVQYISLQAGWGFTVHLSAPTEKQTPFNYAVLAGEAS